MSADIQGASPVTLPLSACPNATGVALGGMLALAAGMGIGRFVYTPILPDMAAALGLSKSAAGLIASANFLGYLAGALLAALPHLPGGRRAWFLGGLTASAATTAAMALTDAMPAFLLLRFIGGIASAFVLVLGSALVLDQLAVLRRPGLAALHFAGVGVGIAVSSVLVDALHGVGADWRALWLVSGAVAALAVPLAVVAGAGSRGRTDARGPGRRPARAPLPRGLGALTLCHTLFGFGYVVTATFLVAVVRAAPQARAMEAVVWLVVGLAAAPSIAAWGRIGRSHRPAARLRAGVLPWRPWALPPAACGPHRRQRWSRPFCWAARSWASPRWASPPPVGWGRSTSAAPSR